VEIVVVIVVVIVADAILIAVATAAVNAAPIHLAVTAAIGAKY
jgi:hypothetical protein